MKVKYIPAIFLLLFVQISLFAQKNFPDTIKVGVYDNPPKVFVNEFGQPDGIFIDVVKSIAHKEHFYIKYVKGDWFKLISMLKDGKIDVMPDVAFSVERDSLFTLNKLSILGSWLEIFTVTKDEINSVLDLKNKRIAVLKGSIQEQYMQTTFKKDFNIDFKLVTYEDYKSTVAALKKHEVDAIAADRFFYFSNLCDKDILPSGIVIRPTELFFAFTKNKYPKLIEIFDKDISLLKNNSNSNYYKSLNKWLYKNYRLQIPLYLQLILVVISTLLVALFLFSFVLQKRINERTKELSLKNEELTNSIKTAQTNEQKFMFLFNNSRQGIVMVETNGKIVTCNKAYCEMLGYTEEELKIKSFYDLTPVKWHEWEQSEIVEEQVLKTGKSITYEKEYIRKDGSIFPIEITGYIIDSPLFDKIYMWGVVSDITERKNSELELIKAKEKAEESDKLKTAFLQNMSHEIRTPLNAICGFANLLSDINFNDEKRNSFISIIQSSSKQLLSIVSDILTISLLETKQEKVNEEKVEINKLLNDLYAIFEIQAKEKNISLLTKRAINDDSFAIKTDKTKLTQILTNLLSNALKFTENGAIEYGYAVLESPGEKKFLNFYVKDTGIGIKDELKQVIFERFRQADNTIHIKYGGTGLGLAISKGFVELLGGEMQVKSEFGKGSTFDFTIPFSFKDS